MSKKPLPLTTLRTWQCPDSYGCRWPPDTFMSGTGNPKSYWNESHRMRRQLYLRLLYEKSKTQKVGCRWHVPGALYTGVSTNVLVICPSMDGAHDIVVRVQKSDSETLGSNSTKHCDLSIACESIVSIRYMNHRGDEVIRNALDTLTRNGETLRKGNLHGVRTNDTGDRGKMFALGARVDPEKPAHLSLYAGNKVAGKHLPEAVKAMSTIGAVAFPQVLKPIQLMERAAGCTTPVCMQIKDDSHHHINNIATSTTVVDNHAGPTPTVCLKNTIGLTMDVSLNLHNSAHYDVNDASVGFAVWTESKPGYSDGWYFVLPNVYGSHPLYPESTFEGIAIQLSHGVAISWDGRRIKHCTAAGKRDPNNNIYGSFCTAKSNLIKQGLMGNGIEISGEGDDKECAETLISYDERLLQSARIPRKSHTDSTIINK